MSHRRVGVGLAAGLAAIGLVLTSCGTEETCRREAIDTYQDYEVTYDVERDVTQVDAAVREHAAGPTIKMSGNCRLHFNGDRLAEAGRNINETHYIGDYDGFVGDGTVRFTDKDGASVDNSAAVSVAAFSVVVPASPSVAGFDVDYVAPDLGGGDVIVSVVRADGVQAALNFGATQSPVSFSAGDLSQLAAGDAVVVRTEIVVHRPITDPAGGSGRISYHHVFAPVTATLAP